jgi:divalent metal cation (Fe/Co/Zn/Cd) transporter
LSAAETRAGVVRRGLHLEYFTLGYNCIEAAVALASGVVASSIALIGFGIDSLIECSSGLTMLWRLRADHDTARREAIERRAQRLIGLSFGALAGYIGYEAIETLLRREAPERSLPGIVLAVASLLIMPLLARAKRRVAHELNSAAMAADSKQTALCSYLSAILLTGLLLNWIWGWWWADPVAGLVMTPIIAREGLSAWRGQGCDCSGHAC